jgi:molecular chaperone GrpE (heat shock protein)
LQQGYIFHDRVLRPAMVKVSSHSESAASGQG